MTDQAVQRPKTEIEDKIIDFVAKRSGVKERYDDYFVTIYANSLLGQRIYCVDWAFEDEQPYYTSYVGAKPRRPRGFGIL
jgi:hypothetical protein